MIIRFITLWICEILEQDGNIFSLSPHNLKDLSFRQLYPGINQEILITETGIVPRGYTQGCRDNFIEKFQQQCCCRFMKPHFTDRNRIRKKIVSATISSAILFVKVVLKIERILFLRSDLASVISEYFLCLSVFLISLFFSKVDENC